MICILSFLPNIYDSNAGQRNGYIETVQSAAKKNRKHPFKFFWLQAGDQMDTERQLNLGFGFPAVVGVSPNKKKYTVMKGSFAEDKLSQFMNDLISGGVSLDDLKTPIKINKVDKWDGKDAPVIEEVINHNIIIHCFRPLQKSCDPVDCSQSRSLH